MEEVIKQLVQEIAEKKDRLKEKADRSIRLIEVENKEKAVEAASNGSLSKNVLYPIAGVSALIGVVSMFKDNKILACLGLGAAVGLVYYSAKKKNSNVVVTTPELQSTFAQKNEFTSKMDEVAKQSAQEWEDFISVRQKRIQAAVDNSNAEKEKKDSILKTLYFYETLSFSIMDMNDEISQVGEDDTCSSSLVRLKDKYRILLLNSIEDAAQKQKLQYESVLKM